MPEMLDVNADNKPSYCRETARRATPVELSTATKQMYEQSLFKHQSVKLNNDLNGQSLKVTHQFFPISGV